MRATAARQHRLGKNHDALLDASDFVRILEMRQGQKVGWPEEIAYRMGYIDRKQLNKLAQGLEKSGYGQYLLQLPESED